MSDILLALDQGTTSTRCIAFSKRGKVLAVAQKPIHLSYPHNGWVEQDAHELWRTSHDVVCDVLQQIPSAPIALGITNQRETIIIWEKATGKPIAPAIVWQDRRTFDVCERLKSQGHESLVQERTGLLLDPYFSATKIAWVLENVAAAREKAQKGELAFGTVDTWILWNLTKGRVHATDATNASRTMLYNLKTHDWDVDLLNLFDIPRSMMPSLHDSIHHFGDAQFKDKNPIPIHGIAGDQQAALIGQECFDEGDCKSTFGTGAFLLMNTGGKFIKSNHRMLTTVGYRVGGTTTYALEGAIFIAGALIQWLRDNMKFFKDASESEALAQSVASSDGVYVVPAFTGLGAPWWRADVRGFISGLTRNTTSAHITRAALESQALQTYDLIDAMENDMGRKITALKIDGGLATNNFVAQNLADILRCDVLRSENVEATAWGAAYLAGVGAGLIPHFGFKVSEHATEKFVPSMKEEERAHLIAGWREALNAVLSGDDFRK